MSLLPYVCFKCGLYDHDSSFCLSRKMNLEENNSERNEPVMERHDLSSTVEDEPYDPWMIVERWQKGKGKVGLSNG